MYKICWHQLMEKKLRSDYKGRTKEMRSMCVQKYVLCDQYMKQNHLKMNNSLQHKVIVWLCIILCSNGRWSIPVINDTYALTNQIFSEHLNKTLIKGNNTISESSTNSVTNSSFNRMLHPTRSMSLLSQNRKESWGTTLWLQWILLTTDWMSRLMLQTR